MKKKDKMQSKSIKFLTFKNLPTYLIIFTIIVLNTNAIEQIKEIKSNQKNSKHISENRQQHDYLNRNVKSVVEDACHLNIQCNR